MYGSFVDLPRESELVVLVPAAVVAVGVVAVGAGVTVVAPGDVGVGAVVVGVGVLVAGEVDEDVLLLELECLWQ